MNAEQYKDAITETVGVVQDVAILKVLWTVIEQIYSHELGVSA